MKTDNYFAHEVEVGDNIVDDENGVMVVTDKEDDGDYILLSVTEEDGEKTELSFGPFDPVPVVASFEDDGEVDVDDEVH